MNADGNPFGKSKVKKRIQDTVKKVSKIGKFNEIKALAIVAACQGMRNFYSERQQIGLNLSSTIKKAHPWPARLPNLTAVAAARYLTRKKKGPDTK